MSVGIYALTLSGCGNGQDRQAKTQSTNAAVQVEVTKAQQELKQIRVSLENMQDAEAAADLHTLTADLTKRMEAVNQSLDRVDAECTTAIAAGERQSTAWHTEANTFSDPDLRNASNVREGELRSKVAALTASHAQLTTARSSFATQISQILSALDLDSSPAGLRSVTPIVNHLLTDEPFLRNALSDVRAKSVAIGTVDHNK